tara:strand:+ start:366 stop:692 length:327 start_codon:yes stop_codon:yes gene_type:complete
MTKDLITITLERDKAKFMASSFESDLKWLGVTSPIDLGDCYIDFIKQVKSEILLNSKNVQEHLDDNELHQIMEIIGRALNRSRDKGLIKGDTDNLVLSITAHIPEDQL